MADDVTKRGEVFAINGVQTSPVRIPKQLYPNRNDVVSHHFNLAWNLCIALAKVPQEKDVLGFNNEFDFKEIQLNDTLEDGARVIGFWFKDEKGKRSEAIDFRQSTNPVTREEWLKKLCPARILKLIGQTASEDFKARIKQSEEAMSAIQAIRNEQPPITTATTSLTNASASNVERKYKSLPPRASWRDSELWYDILLIKNPWRSAKELIRRRFHGSHYYGTPDRQFFSVAHAPGELVMERAIVSVEIGRKEAGKDENPGILKKTFWWAQDQAEDFKQSAIGRKISANFAAANDGIVGIDPLAQLDADSLLGPRTEPILER